MVDVAMVGAGQTPYGTHPAAMKDMWADAVRACFDTIDGDLAPSSVDEVFLLRFHLQLNVQSQMFIEAIWPLTIPS